MSPNIQWKLITDGTVDASRFLAQSQSRISFAPREDRRGRPDKSRRPNQGGWRSTTGTRAPQPRGNNPYQPSSSQVSGFPFASRLQTQQAPLFYSATDEFREETDEQEHEREIADYYALQKSRRQIGGSDIEESETENSPGASQEGPQDGQAFGRGGGIRSSWRGSAGPERFKNNPKQSQKLARTSEDTNSEDESSGKGKMVDVRLESTVHSQADLDEDPPDDLIHDPPSIQQLRKPSREVDSALMNSEMDQEPLLDDPRPPFSDTSAGPQIPAALTDPPRHDAFFAHIYFLAVGGMFTTWFMVFISTHAPDSKHPLGDTIYSTLHASYHLLATYTLAAIFVSLFWLAALRAYVRPLVYVLVAAVPIILYSFALYPLITSFKGSWDGSSVQDKVMRWGSIIPAIIATCWIIAIGQGRKSLHKAISILEFATKILAANPPLIVVGFATLGAVVAWTWIWLAMFTRVFLGGHLSTRGMLTKFVIDTTTWWAGAYFIIIYLWTVGMIFGLQRSISAATVSQWYFHRLSVPSPNSNTVVRAASSHAFTTLLGTTAFSTGLSLLVRLPLLVLPRRMTVIFSSIIFSLIPSPLAALINPLTLTYAAIHSRPLGVSARGLTQLRYLAPNNPTTSLHPNTFSAKRQDDGWRGDNSALLPYRLGKLLLYSFRFMMSMALGFGGWAATAHSIKVAGTDVGLRGSLYAYIVGLIAGAIGWTVLGAMEGVIACVVDAVVVCWGSEVGSNGQGEARYCREAGWLFGDDTSPEERQVALP